MSIVEIFILCINLATITLSIMALVKSKKNTKILTKIEQPIEIKIDEEKQREMINQMIKSIKGVKKND